MARCSRAGSARRCGEWISLGVERAFARRPRGQDRKDDATRADRECVEATSDRRCGVRAESGKFRQGRDELASAGTRTDRISDGTNDAASHVRGGRCVHRCREPRSADERRDLSQLERRVQRAGQGSRDAEAIDAGALRLRRLGIERCTTGGEPSIRPRSRSPRRRRSSCCQDAAARMGGLFPSTGRTGSSTPRRSSKPGGPRTAPHSRVTWTPSSKPRPTSTTPARTVTRFIATARARETRLVPPGASGEHVRGRQRGRTELGSIGRRPRALRPGMRPPLGTL